MPKRTDIHTVLIIGAGPIVIGQACEFDYSGAQACKALREEGYRVVLVNSNPATIMTDPGLADATYIEPITPEFVEKIIARERPNVPPGKVFALLPTMGGQTALNTALSLRKIGALERHNIELIGATADAIDKAEDRERFKQAMAAIGLETPKGITLKGQLRQKKDSAGHLLFDGSGMPVTELSPESFTRALAALDQVGLPTVIRPSFTMGGTGGGIAYNREEFFAIVESGLEASPTNEVLIEESVLGWKEFEMEVVRDKADNCIIICSIENIDAMGVHTGDSITIAPILTLTDKEYQRMRSASIAVLREIGVETGGSNVQFAVNPKNGRMVVIEMNPRVSRSSALASKATGFPIAKIAAKLAIGYTLDELKNDITKVTPASFEPTIDYVVSKIPRFAFEKFPGAEPLLTTAMKSVGEAMAIGRTFQESIQKALRSLETGLTGFDEITTLANDKTAIRAALARPTPDRLLVAAQAMRFDFPLEEIQKITGYDPWFVGQIQELIHIETEIRKGGLPKGAKSFRRLKGMGFSDARLAKLTGQKEDAVRAARHALDIHPCYKRIDTCAAEFAALTPYMYSTYEAPFGGETVCESDPTDKKKIIILGGGPNRIGQGIEFDYCCCHAAFSLSAQGYETIMVNCNPETVSTDYDTSDRLYFEPLTAEDVLEIVAKEQSNGTLVGVIVQFGGQTPLKLANTLRDAGVPILGTSADAIDLAEDRKRFQKLLEDLNLKQPRNATVMTADEAVTAAAEIGYPVILRPSYVLGGRGMVVVSDEAQLKAEVKSGELFRISGDNPVLIDGFLNRATEVDVDAICDVDNDVFIAGIMEHIEEAGVHSGDSACSLPPHTLKPEIIAEIERQTIAMARALNVRGLMNVQYAIQGDEIFVLEVNPRASRTVPFVAKAIGLPVAAIASRVMAGETLASFNLKPPHPKHISVKEAVLPFARFPGVDTILGPEMRSTGEVMGLDTSFGRAFAKSQIGAGVKLPLGGTVFISVKDGDKDLIEAPARELVGMGFSLIATRGTAKILADAGLPVTTINKVLEGRPHVVDALKNGEIHLVFNTTDGAQALADSSSIRRAALTLKVPYYTTMAGAKAAAAAIAALRTGSLEVAPLQSYSL
jgi:carbamoyl-phosphate synthase large subunit